MASHHLEESKRTPNLPFFLNGADRIEAGLAEDGHRIWGWVIYRCTYANDNEFNEFVARLRSNTTEDLQFYNGLDMMETLDFTVFEDKSRFDKASTTLVREQFKQWTAKAAQQEQNTEAKNSQRYRYCLMVDDEVLESVHEDEHGIGFVKMIQRDWPLNPPRAKECDEEPIEGCTWPDVGWMKVESRHILVDKYDQLREREAWTMSTGGPQPLRLLGSLKFASFDRHCSQKAQISSHFALGLICDSDHAKSSVASYQSSRYIDHREYVPIVTSIKMEDRCRNAQFGP